MRIPARGFPMPADLVKSLPPRRLNRAEQSNKLHIFVVGWTTKCCTAFAIETIVCHGIRQRTHNHSALGSIDHDLVFVVDRHTRPTQQQCWWAVRQPPNAAVSSIPFAEELSIELFAPASINDAVR